MVTKIPCPPLAVVPGEGPNPVSRMCWWIWVKICLPMELHLLGAQTFATLMRANPKRERGTKKIHHSVRNIVLSATTCNNGLPSQNLLSQKGAFFIPTLMHRTHAPRKSRIKWLGKYCATCVWYALINTGANCFGHISLTPAGTFCHPL